MNLDSKIFIAGHKGLVGGAIFDLLLKSGYKNIITINKNDVDLRDSARVQSFFAKENIDVVFLAAAKVGGILANNTYRADFIYDNLAIQNNIIYNSYKYGVKKLLFLGSSCIYPKFSKQPIKEEYLLNGELEYTNEPYAIAKIAGIKMCESFNIQYKCNFLSVMPTNLYGKNDNFHLEKSHVIPALIRKIYLAKLLEENNTKLLKLDLGENYLEALSRFNITKNYVSLWGSGEGRREFLYVDDLARACVFIMQNINFGDLIESKTEIRNTHINIGYGDDISIRELAFLIKEIIGFRGDIRFSNNNLDGTPSKLLDSSLLKNLGFTPEIDLKLGIKKVFESYVDRLHARL